MLHVIFLSSSLHHHMPTQYSVAIEVTKIMCKISIKIYDQLHNYLNNASDIGSHVRTNVYRLPY